MNYRKLIDGKRFSRDDKVVVLPLERFIERHHYFLGISSADMFTLATIPEEFGTYYKFTHDKLICIYYRAQQTNYGLDTKPLLNLIELAYRDGKTEYDLIDSCISQTEEEISLNKKKSIRSKLQSKLEEQKKTKSFLRTYLPEYHKYGSELNDSPMSFDGYLIDTGYRANPDEYKVKYVVFDVETNGLRRASDDLLSLSIFDPFSGIAYNRFFPLDQQPLVLTSYINGITDDDLKDSLHMTQAELDWVIDYFDLNNSVLLSYSGGEGTFDSSFVINYCKRHKLHGFNNLQFDNIKKYLPPLPFGVSEMSKDNLCSLFDIDGVQDTHTSLNDCILEWRLFEQISSRQVFFIGEHLYRYHPDYILPVSYLNSYPELCESAGVKVPEIVGVPRIVYEYVFPKKALKDLQKFPTNITGVTLEHLLNSLIGAQKQDNTAFLSENKGHLEYICSVETNINAIPVVPKRDGTFTSVRKENEEYVNAVNAVTLLIKDHLSETVDFVKNDIFRGKDIISQELIISKNRKVLALCDLSTPEAVLEIKTMNVLKELPGYGTCVKPNFTRQLYYESDSRETYLLQFRFERNSLGDIKDLRIQIYNIDIREVSREEYPLTSLTAKGIAVLELLLWNPVLKYTVMQNITGMPANKISILANQLTEDGYLINQGTSRKAFWIVTEKYTKLRPPFDSTKPVYVYDRKTYDRHLCGAAMIKEYASITDVAKDMNLPEGYIALLCRHEGRLHFKQLLSHERNKKRLR